MREQNQNILWYEESARNWNEALPFGNGRLGGMIFEGVTQEKIKNQFKIINDT